MLRLVLMVGWLARILLADSGSGGSEDGGSSTGSGSGDGGGATSSGPPSGATGATGDGGGDGEGDPNLGDAGKVALERERRARREAEQRAQAFEDELKTLRQKGMTENERAIAKAREEGIRAEREVSNRRLITAEIRAAAAGKLRDPSDALAHIDPGYFRVGDDGEVDRKEIDAALKQLLEDKPYLAAGNGTSTRGSADGGARPPGSGPTINDLLRAAAKGSD